MNKQFAEGLEPGEARSAGKTVQEMMDEERRDVPDLLRRKTYVYNGSDDLDLKRWTSQEFHDLEMEHMWTKVWQMACRLEEIPEVGDHIVYDIGDYSFIVVRSDEDTVKAYYNSCLHRGTQLRPAGAEGNAEQFRCPFHGWTWSLSGELIDLPCDWDFPHVDKAKANLPEIRVDFWGGFVFINMDEEAESLANFLGDMPSEFEAWNFENKYKQHHVGTPGLIHGKLCKSAFMTADTRHISQQDLRPTLITPAIMTHVVS